MVCWRLLKLVLGVGEVIIEETRDILPCRWHWWILAKHIKSDGIMRGSSVLGATSKLVSQDVVVQFPGLGYKLIL